ncbi:MAG: hypothetical protein ACYC67_11885 [Prosthecobacter sp.]|jgi:hypothetical protein
MRVINIKCESKAEESGLKIVAKERRAQTGLEHATLVALLQKSAKRCTPTKKDPDTGSSF